MTEFGGSNDKGVIFSIASTSNTTYKKFLDFDGTTNGANPVGSLLLASDGFLYGMTKAGGANNLGVIFKIGVDGTGYTKLIDLSTTTGSAPVGSLVEFTDGKLYGTTTTGGASGFGTVFSITKSGTFTKVVEFNGTNGRTPFGDLLVAPSGTVMYGTTFAGGSGNRGVLFKLENGSAFTKLYDFTLAGYAPIGVIAMERESQEINFPPVETRDLAEPFIPATSSVNSGPVYFSSSNSLVATVDQNMIQGVGEGTSTITSYNAGNYRYRPATAQITGVPKFSVAQQVVNFKRSPQKIYFLPIPEKKFNDADFILPATSGSGLPVTFQSSNTSILTITNDKAKILKAGTVSITAKQAGNTLYAPANDTTVQLVIKKLDQQITANTPESISCCSSLTVPASSSSGSEVILTSANPDVLKIETFTPFTFTPLRSGNAELVYYQAGNENYNPVELRKPVQVKKALQVITMNPLLSEYTFGRQPSFISAPAGTTAKTNPSGILAFQDGFLHFVGIGETTITFSLAGNDRYAAATDVVKQIKVVSPPIAPTTNIITWPVIGVQDISAGSLQLTGFASSGLPLTYKATDPSMASISGNIVTPLKVGDVTITASQPGNSNIAAATPVSRTISFAKATQTIPLVELACCSIKANARPVVLPKLSSAGLPVTHKSSNLDVITVEDGVLYFVGGGSATLELTQSGNDKYTSTTSKYNISVIKVDQAVTFKSIAPRTYGNAPFKLEATASSGYPVIFTSSDNSIVSISGTIATVHKVGSVVITASAPASMAYNSASTTRSVTVSKAPQTIQFTAPTVFNFGASPFTISATTESNLPVTFSTTTPGTVKISGNIVQLAASGTGTIIASQEGNAYYLAAQPVTHTLTIGESASSNFPIVNSVGFGGPNNSGYIYKMNSNGSGITPLKLYNPYPFFSARGGFIKASDGKLYAVSYQGGTSNSGQIIRMEPDGSGIKTIFSFQQTESGRYPQGELEEASDGYFYTTTTSGGKNGFGCIVKVSKDGLDYKVIYNFTNSYGGIVIGGVTQGLDGRLYGVFNDGGFLTRGSVFSVKTDGTDFRVLITLNNSIGHETKGKPVRDANGYLYVSINQDGDPVGGGNILKFNKDGNYLTMAHGGAPASTPLLASDGKLYGVRLGGPPGIWGRVFSVNPDGTGVVNLHGFTTTDGRDPQCRLMEGSDGMIYGTTTKGGANNFGTIFKINKNGTNFTLLHSFDDATGSTPLYGGLVEGTPGNFFGTTSTGGPNNIGVIYKITSAGQYTVVSNFVNDEYSPGPVVPDATGDRYYSLTTAGKPGLTNGTLFSMKPDGSDYKSVMDLPTDMTVSRFFHISTGHLWVFATQATANFIFRIKTDGTGFEKLLTYDNSTAKGNTPFVLFEKSDAIYGMTRYGGLANQGVLFKINKDGTGFAKVGDIPATDFNRGTSAAISSPDGNFYAVALEIPAVFSMTTSGVYKLIKRAPTSYVNPRSIIELTNGDLAICTIQGGTDDGGSILGISKDGKTLQTIYVFRTAQGRRPQQMLQAVDGWIYVTTDVGGPFAQGSLFKVRADGGANQSLVDFTASVGYQPRGFVFAKTSQTFTFAPIDSKKVSDAPFLPVTTSSSVARVQFTSSDPNVAVVDNGMIRLVGVGTTTITGSLPENSNFYAAPNVIQRQLVVTLGEQVITFDSFSPVRVGNPQITLAARSSSGLPITYSSSNSAVAKVEGDKLTIISSGTAIITAAQPGNTSYSAAPSVQQTIKVYSDGVQSITFPVISDRTIGDPAVTLNATATSSLPVTYTAKTSTISITGNTLSFLAPGKASLEASQPGDEEWFAATPVKRDFCINPLKPTVTATISLPLVTLKSSSDTGNQWFKDGELIPGADLDQLTVDEDGLYSVISTVDGCDSDPSEVFIVTTALQDEELAHVDVYPNPATSSIFVAISDVNSSRASIQLINALGITSLTSEAAGNSTVSIDVSDLPAGVYIVKVQVAERVFIKRISKL